MYFSLFLLQVVDQISNNDIILHSGLICMHGFFAIYIRRCVYMYFNNANKSVSWNGTGFRRGWVWERQRERSQREKAFFFHPVQWISNSVLSQRTIHALKSWAAALNETPGEQYGHYTEQWMEKNHFGSQATVAFGRLDGGSGIWRIIFQFVCFHFTFITVGRISFLKGELHPHICWNMNL